jgi:hypothetical protein
MFAPRRARCTTTARRLWPAPWLQSANSDGHRHALAARARNDWSEPPRTKGSNKLRERFVQERTVRAVSAKLRDTARR